MQSPSQDRVVAYIDIMGWRHAFDSLGHDALVTVAREIADHKSAFSPAQKAKLWAWEENMTCSHGMKGLGCYYEISFSFVSDSFVISAPVTNLRGLLSVSKWACMCLLGNHGFLTRGGIAVGRLTHDMHLDIAIGRPLVEAVQIEETTKMPRVTLSQDAMDLSSAEDFLGLIYNDGEQKVLNIANRSGDWLAQSMMRIEAALASGLDERKIEKWRYIEQHLPAMATQGK